LLCKNRLYCLGVGRLALLVSCVLATLILAAPASAKDPTGSCTAGGTAGTKQTYTCRLGPIVVAPYQVLNRELHFNPPKPLVDGHITDMQVDVVDADGAQVPINRLMLHHIVFLNHGSSFGEKRDLTCGSSFTGWDSRSLLPNAAERFYAAGEERAKLSLPPGNGYPVAKDDLWLMSYMLMNHRSTVDRAYIEYEVTVDTAPGLTPVKPFWLDVENCQADPVYDVPGGGRRGATHKRSFVWTVPEAGRLVAGGGHVHGGGKNLTLRRPDCSDQRVYTSRPVWGGPRHPFYNVRPVLHEPGPIHMTGFRSARGVPVAAGERVVLDSNYDATQPHTRVMGISLVYLAPDPSVTAKCGALPRDLEELPRPAGRRKPPPFKVPIVGIRNGKAVNIDAPPGRRAALGRRGSISVGGFFFKRPNVSVRPGSMLTWRFDGEALHNVTLANGPRGFSSPNLSDGRTYSKRLRVPGTYQLFCGLHPVDMTATVKVTRRR
jgi:plastocyanin